MIENFYESELRKDLKIFFDAGELRVIGDSSVVFKNLANSYPAVGSKIDWSQVAGSIGCVEEKADLQVERFAHFFYEMVCKFGLSGNVIYAGDSATDFALEGSVNAIGKALPELLSVPQHHYFIGPECSWCMCFTMEGHMNFGRKLKCE